MSINGQAERSHLSVLFYFIHSQLFENISVLGSGIKFIFIPGEPDCTGPLMVCAKIPIIVE